MASQLDHTPPVPRSCAGVLKVYMCVCVCWREEGRCITYTYVTTITVRVHPVSTHFEHPSFMTTATRFVKSSITLNVAFLTSPQRHLPVQGHKFMIS